MLLKNDEDDHANRTFINPFNKKIIVDIDVEVQKDENLLIEKNEDVNDKDDKTEEEFKCELCIFKTKNIRRLERHKFENHSVKGKYICILCKQEFGTRKTFNNHNYFGCGGGI